MSQTVYDVGDPITSRLSLGVVPDGTTVATVVVKRPDGTPVTVGAVSGWAGDVKTAQWWATDDGSQDGTTLASAGDWLAVWTVTGMGTNVAAKVYNVQPLPATGTRLAWSPFLSQVADYVPRLTVDTTLPGSAIELGTFTGATLPTDEIAQRHIDNAVAGVSAACPGLVTVLEPLARTVAALRAAASIQRAYSNTALGLDTLSIAAALDARADAELARLQKAVDDYADGDPDDDGFDIVPMWQFDRPTTLFY